MGWASLAFPYGMLLRKILFKKEEHVVYLVTELDWLWVTRALTQSSARLFLLRPASASG